MARGAPVTLDDVEATLRTIEGAGIKPTVRLVHQKLGRGSLSTITAHLRTVAASRAEADVGGLPDPVLATLRGMADTLWIELADAADARIDAVGTAAEARVRQACEARDAAQASLADLRDERGALVATLAERDAQLVGLGKKCEALTGELGTVERQAALDERDRTALATRLDDRDAELQRAIAACERSDAALVGLTDDRDRLGRALDVERTRRETETAAHEDALARRHEALEASRTEIAALTAAHARLDTRLEAHDRRAGELAVESDTLRRERDAAFERNVTLDDRLEQAHAAISEYRRSADGDRHAVLAMRDHIERLESQLRDTGIDAAAIAAPSSDSSSEALPIGAARDARTRHP